MKGKIPLAEAHRIAWLWRDRLIPDCKRIEIAGSIRRECETVGDIEIVAIPKPALFGRIHDLTYSRKGSPPIVVTKGAPGLLNGKARYIQIYDAGEKIYLDLFLCMPETWGVIFAIRTGSAEFSHGLMIRANKLGMTSIQGRIHQATDNGFCIAAQTPEERDVFEALQIQWVEPPQRHGFSDIKPL